MQKHLLFIVLVYFTVFPVLSQENTKGIRDTLHLEEVIVTGSPVKVSKNNVPMAVSVVNREQIEESNESAILPVLNGRVPGLFVTERGVTGFGVSTGAAGQITLRGIGGSPTTGVLILIDGHPQFMGIFGHPLADSYVASDVERVEVIRGPASILYGSNAMGGVINIITRKQTKSGIHGNANIMYGSYNTQKYMAAVGYKKDKFSAFASFNHDQTDGHRANSDFNINNGYLKVGYEINKNLRVNTDFSIAHFKATDPGPDTIGAQPGNKLDITRGYWAFDLENEYEKLSGTAKVFYNFGEHDISDGFHSTDANYGINIHESVHLFKDNNITVGADYLDYGGKAENNEYGVIYKDTTIYEAGIYGFVQQMLFGKLTLNAGLRLQDHEVYGKQWIPSGGFAFRAAKQTTWKASVSKGFRSPTVKELFVKMWGALPNAGLKPEKTISYETSVLQLMGENKIQLELTGYILEASNLIVGVRSGGVYQLQNTDKISNKGVEFSANANLLRNLAVAVTYSFIDMKTPVYATPKHHIFTSCRYHWNKFYIMASIQYINHLDTDPSSEVYFQNYTLLNTKISYRIGKYAGVFASGENLLDQEYETNRYYTMPGVTVFGGVNVTF